MIECVGCNRVRYEYARGLCRDCHAIPVLRNVVAPRRRTRHAPTELDVQEGRVSPARPLPEPTEALPGTPEKLRVLARRRSKGQQLWHPKDATHEGQKTPSLVTCLLHHRGRKPGTRRADEEDGDASDSEGGGVHRDAGRDDGGSGEEFLPPDLPAQGD